MASRLFAACIWAVGAVLSMMAILSDEKISDIQVIGLIGIFIAAGSWAHIWHVGGSIKGLWEAEDDETEEEDTEDDKPEDDKPEDDEPEDDEPEDDEPEDDKPEDDEPPAVTAAAAPAAAPKAAPATAPAPAVAVATDDGSGGQELTRTVITVVTMGPKK